jgi:2-octaprenyl-6-methoxyphenol hydroxylase
MAAPPPRPEAAPVYDLLIAGGGLVGASLACALAGQGARIALVEAVPFDAAQQPSYDERTVALAFGSRLIFEGMGLWPLLAAEATPIRSIHTSDRGHFGVTRLDCREEGVEALGYVVQTRLMGRALAQRLEGLPDVELLSPAVVCGAEVAEDRVACEVECAGVRRALTARLIVAADGAGSTVRERLGIAVDQRDYGQSAIIANITPEKPHGNVAYERFTESGPLALLPMDANRCGLVWTRRDEDVATLLAASDEHFLAALQDCFGWRLGRLRRVGERRAYPLSLVQVRDPVRPRGAVIGNAAHTLHPIAGQGFNLGLRDASVLAEVVAEALRHGRDPGDWSVLKRYAEWRRADQRRVIAFTDGLARLFSSRFAPLVLARNLGMLGIDLLPPLKHALARQSMGLAGRLPRLARGLPLTGPAGR